MDAELQRLTSFYKDLPKTGYWVRRLFMMKILCVESGYGQVKLQELMKNEGVLVPDVLVNSHFKCRYCGSRFRKYMVFTEHLQAIHMPFDLLSQSEKVKYGGIVRHPVEDPHPHANEVNDMELAAGFQIKLE